MEDTGLQRWVDNGGRQQWQAGANPSAKTFIILYACLWRTLARSCGLKLLQGTSYRQEPS